jgi:uncharacterized protein (DUF302 family)
MKTEDAMQRQYSKWIFLIVVACAGNNAGAALPGVTVRSVQGGFDDIRDRMVMAIENRGLVLNYTAHVGDMLERTGKDLGRQRRVYGKAEVLEFCSAALSRTTMEVDPRNIVFCPYAIAVYALPDEPGKIYIAYRKPLTPGSGASTRALREVGRLLDDIVREALKP